MRELEHFKHSVVIFLKITGGPSDVLCTYLLKFIDAVDLLSHNREKANQEFVELAFCLMKSVCDGLADRIKQLDNSSESNDLINRLQDSGGGTLAEQRLILFKSLQDGYRFYNKLMNTNISLPEFK